MFAVPVGQHECRLTIHQCHFGVLLYGFYSFSLWQLAEAPHPCYANYICVMVLSVHDRVRHAYRRFKCEYFSVLTAMGVMPYTPYLNVTAS